MRTVSWWANRTQSWTGEKKAFLEHGLEFGSAYLLFPGFSIRILFIFFLDRVSLCISGCSGTHYVDQAGLELTEIYLSLFLE